MTTTIRRRNFILGMVVPWLAPAGHAQPALARIENIQRAVRSEMARQQIPGLSVAVATGGQLRWSDGFGFADLENQVRATRQTMYRLASISKPITAVATLQLAESGRLDLDRPVRTYLPEFPAKRWPVTLRELLGHLGGIRHYRTRDEFNSTRHYTDLLSPLDLFARDPLIAEPGTRYSYSTYGYVLLGAVVERVSGQSFAGYVRDHIAKPAGLETLREDNVYRLIPHRARGYRKNKAGVIENCALADTSNKIPGGGMISTASDLVKFALAVRDGKLLRPETVRMMWTPQALRSGERTRYGLGWFVREHQGKKVVGHSGGQQGVSTLLRMIPDDGIVVAVMTNLENADAGAIVGRVTAELPAGASR